MCVCAHWADWAGVLAIRKTTSGKVHINHVPQLKERNGAEMGGWRRRKNNEGLCLRYSELLRCTVCSDTMLEAFMNKQGHDKRPKATRRAVRPRFLFFCCHSSFFYGVSLLCFVAGKTVDHRQVSCPVLKKRRIWFNAFKIWQNVCSKAQLHLQKPPPTWPRFPMMLSVWLIIMKPGR